MDHGFLSLEGRKSSKRKRKLKALQNYITDDILQEIEAEKANEISRKKNKISKKKKKKKNKKSKFVLAQLPRERHEHFLTPMF